MNFIDTGYKPQFALGALYQGENAADAQFGNEQDFIKQILANQKSEQEMPLDLDVKRYEADLANAKRDPKNGYIPSLIDGYRAQMELQRQAANRGLATQNSTIASTNAKNYLESKKAMLGDSYYDEALKEADKIIRGEGGGIGFPMKSQMSVAPTSGFNWKIPGDVQQARDTQAGQLITEELGGREGAQERVREINRALSTAKGDARGILEGERKRILAGLEGINNGSFTVEGTQPIQNAVGTGDSKLNQLRNLVASDPDYLQKKSIAEGHDDNSLAIALLRKEMEAMKTGRSNRPTEAEILEKLDTEKRFNHLRGKAMAGQATEAEKGQLSLLADQLATAKATKQINDFILSGGTLQDPEKAFNDAKANFLKGYQTGVEPQQPKAAGGDLQSAILEELKRRQQGKK